MSDLAGASPFQAPVAPRAPMPAAEPRAAGWWAIVDRLLERLGDRLNPILVKEARQALKSKQFVITFALLLLCAWGWSLLGLASYGPEVAYGAKGAEMFFGYYLLLTFCLLVIVPFGAFRSLAIEQEDRTYELLSITALNPRQVVAGKLGSAVVQMVVYLSAIAPCLAFTYMLRGIDFPTILFFLFWTVAASLGFAAIGLLLGTLTQQKALQVILSVLAIIGLLLAWYVSLAISNAFLMWDRIEFTDPDFWPANGMILTAYLTYFALVFYAAVAQVTFSSDNRSTRLRIIMLVQFACLAGWIGWWWFGRNERDGELLLVFAILAGLHWYTMGMFMTGEWPELSLRVKRNLPQSFLGRVFLTWFNPGPGTGYLYAIGGLLATMAVVLFALPTVNNNRPTPEALLAFCVAGFCYVVIYLGVGLLIVRLLRRALRVEMLVGLLVHVILVLLGCALPAVVQAMLPGWRLTGYSLVQITNFFWTLLELGDKPSLSPYTPVLMTVLPLAALVVFLLNLPAVVRELRHVRIAAPERVVEEDAALAAEVSPPSPPQPLSPWD